MSGRAEMPVGDQLGPMFDNWVVFYNDVRNPPDDSLIGKICVCGLSDGQVLIKTLVRGSKEGLSRLIPNSAMNPNSTAPTLDDVDLDWVTPVCEMRPAENGEEEAA